MPHRSDQEHRHRNVIQPLSYESLKTVIQYMEPNSRFQISHRCPSIRSVEKLIPLKFDTVEFDRVYTQVNQTKYRLGVYRQYHDGEEIPKDHETKNANGGIERDINDGGFEVFSMVADVSPGDVDIRLPENVASPWLFDRVFDDRQYAFEKHIEIYEKAVTMKLEQSPDLSIARGQGEAIFSEAFFYEINNPVEYKRAERGLLEVILPLSVEQLREKIDYFHACFIPYRCRRDNTPIPFTPLIQFTVESPTGTRVYRHSYTLKLQQVMKKLNTVLFGGRYCVHRSRILNIMKARIVLRLPEGVRMKIQELRLTGYVHLNYEALKLIVEESSYPLNSLTLTDGLTVETQYRQPILKSSKRLCLKPSYRFYYSCLPILRLLKNETTHVSCLLWPFPVEDQVHLVELWLNDEKVIGTSLSYDIEGLEVVTELLSQISLQFNGIRQTDNIVVLPMNNGNRLKVSFTSIEQPDNQDEDQTFRVEMNVVDAENLLLS